MSTFDEAIAAHEDQIERMKRERDKARELVKQWEDKARDWMATPEAAKRLDCYRELTEQNAALRDALRVRISVPWCSECGKYMFGQGRHYEPCPHAKTEREAMQ